MDKMPRAKHSKRYRLGEVVYNKIQMPSKERDKLTEAIVALGEDIHKDDFVRIVLGYSSIVDLRYMRSNIDARLRTECINAQDAD
jgi:hypothetical protein